MKGQGIFEKAGGNQDLFGEVPDAPKKPGRSQELAERRNKKMAARLYYYRNFHPLVKNEVIMRLMCEDFDLSAVRIAEVLAELNIELQRLKVAKPGLEWFWERWPRMLWSVNKLEFDKYDNSDDNN